MPLRVEASLEISRYAGHSDKKLMASLCHFMLLHRSLRVAKCNENQYSVSYTALLGIGLALSSLREKRRTCVTAWDMDDFLASTKNTFDSVINAWL